MSDFDELAVSSRHRHVCLAWLLVACCTREGDPPSNRVAGEGAGVRAEQCALQSVELTAALPTAHPPLPRANIASASAGKGGREIVARWYDARIHVRPDPASMVIGYARRGQTVRVRGGVRGTGCPADMWYELADGGYACAAREFREAHVEVPDPVRPRLDESLPYGYARVVVEGAPSFEQLPSVDLLEAALRALELGHDPVPAVPLRGAHFITSVETLEHEGRRFHRTDAGRYVLDEHVAVLAPTPLRGEPLSGAEQLPLGFVRVPDAPVRCACAETTVPCGVAQPFARIRIHARRTGPEGELLVTDSGHLLAAAHVGVAELHTPPDIGDGEPWIHVNLAQQTLVAYEGTRPVYATLVSTGKGKHATPTGLWRIDRKYVSTTMSGPDEERGSYTVSEVPWTMFYDGDFALHGAYWHTAFGQVRSHGCTNLPPADARWLFAWSGDVPPGWHAASHLKGPWVYITEGD